MGLMSKIEDKLSSSHKHESESKPEKQSTKHELGHSSGSQSNNTNPIQNPVQSQAGNTGTHIPGQSGTDDYGRGATSDARHAHETYGGQQSTGTGIDRSRHPTERTGNMDNFRDYDGYGDDSTRGPRQPFDPYSSKGQQAAANAGTSGERNFGGGRRSHEDSHVPRSRVGGVGNSHDSPRNDYSSSSSDAHTRRHGGEAIPTAGGQKLGSDSENDRYPSGPDSHQHHYGRDAALAGGAGAAGVGAYEAGHHHNNSRGDTGPASNTLGPHKSNAGNIMDPRVQPQADQMYDRTTAGPHRSDMANRMDPRVDSDRSKAHDRDQHHYGRDAALAGGAGAAGYGAHEMGKDHHHGRDSRERERDNAPVGSAYSSDEPSRHHLGRHDQQDYRSGQRDAYGDQQSRRSGDRYDDVSYMNRPNHGTHRDDDNHYSDRQQQHHPIRDAALAGSGGAGAGALADRHHHDHQGQQDQPGSYGGQRGNNNNTSSAPGSTGGMGSGAGVPSGLPTEKKLGGAYEAGYRDALEHMRADMQKQQL